MNIEIQFISEDSFDEAFRLKQKLEYENIQDVDIEVKKVKKPNSMTGGGELTDILTIATPTIAIAKLLFDFLKDYFKNKFELEKAKLDLEKAKKMEETAQKKVRLTIKEDGKDKTLELGTENMQSLEKLEEIVKEFNRK
jgi:hypothetical protein